ncbi:MAG: ABC transporter ATP-binding protein [Burkholderiaceae bacterium]|nr:ABC transporter ATP-binding protein [Burkholderiaceae bacterium]
MEQTPELVIHGAAVTVGDPERQILRGVDLSLPKGQVLALLGASGCGKTTLLRAIAGLSPLSQGRIEIAGRDLTHVPTQQRGVGVVFQQYALFPNLSVLENIKFGVLAQGHGQREARQRADELLELIELGAHSSKLPAQLSGGQRQRVALARALACKPSLLLMDEPFSALDESFRIPLRRSFRQLQQSLGQTCLVVTHDREEAFELADQVAVMFDGRIEQCSSPTELWRAPRTRRVADFLGAFNQWQAERCEADMQRACGHWIAPISALERASAPQGDELWPVRARVLARYVGQHHVTVELADSQDQPLSWWCRHDEPQPQVGDWLDLGVRRSLLQYLPD